MTALIPVLLVESRVSLVIIFDEKKNRNCSLNRDKNRSPSKDDDRYVQAGTINVKSGGCVTVEGER